MAITVRGSAVDAPTSLQNSLTVNKPTGTVQNDVMLAWMCARESGAWNTIPSGWTEIEDGTQAGLRVKVWYKVAGASEPSDYTWGYTINDVPMCGGIIALANCDTTTPINVSSVNEDNVGSTSMTATGVTTTVDDCMLVYFGSQKGARSPFTHPSGMTEEFDIESVTSEADASGLCAYELLGAAGATGDRTATSTASTDWSNFLIAVAPSAISTVTAEFDAIAIDINPSDILIKKATNASLDSIPLSFGLSLIARRAFSINLETALGDPYNAPDYTDVILSTGTTGEILSTVGAINTTISKAEEALASLQTAVADPSTDLATLQAAVRDIDEAVGALNASVHNDVTGTAGLLSGIFSNSEDQAGLQAAVSRIAEELSGLESAVLETEEDQAGAETAVAQDQEDSGGLISSILTAIEDQAGIETAVGETEEDQGGLEAGLSSNEEDQGGLESAVKENSEPFAGLLSGIFTEPTDAANVESAISVLSENLASILTAIKVTIDQAINIKAALSSQEELTSDLLSGIWTTVEDSATMRSRIAELRYLSRSMRSAISRQIESLATLAGSVYNTVNAVGGINAGISTDIESSINDLKSAISRSLEANSNASTAIRADAETIGNIVTALKTHVEAGATIQTASWLDQTSDAGLSASIGSIAEVVGDVTSAVSAVSELAMSVSYGISFYLDATASAATAVRSNEEVLATMRSYVGKSEELTADIRSYIVGAAETNAGMLSNISHRKFDFRSDELKYGVWSTKTARSLLSAAVYHTIDLTAGLLTHIFKFEPLFNATFDVIKGDYGSLDAFITSGTLEAALERADSTLENPSTSTTGDISVVFGSP